MKKIIIIFALLNSCALDNNSHQINRSGGIAASNISDFLTNIQTYVIYNDTASFKSLIEFPVQIQGSTDYDLHSMDEVDFDKFFPEFLNEWAGMELVDTYFDKSSGLSKTNSRDTVRNQIIFCAENFRVESNRSIDGKFQIGPLIIEKRHKSWKIITIFSNWNPAPISTNGAPYNVEQLAGVELQIQID